MQWPLDIQRTMCSMYYSFHYQFIGSSKYTCVSTMGNADRMLKTRTKKLKGQVKYLLQVE
uniref:Uncharacterized protein n=1 Tax=Rhizophora mucronata TaxID=61149 RepID=A0A2P2IJF4_RHIMU